MNAEQAKQKNNHDCGCQSREYFVGRNVQAHNFRAGPRWAPGIIVERLGPLMYLGVFWRCHIDHLRPAHDKPLEQNMTPNNAHLFTRFTFTKSV